MSCCVARAECFTYKSNSDALLANHCTSFHANPQCGNSCMQDSQCHRQSHVSSPYYGAHYVHVIMITPQLNPAGSLQDPLLQEIAQAFASYSPKQLNHHEAHDTLPGCCTTHHGLPKRLALLLQVSNLCNSVTEHVQSTLHNVCKLLHWSTVCTAPMNARSLEA